MSLIIPRLRYFSFFIAFAVATRAADAPRLSSINIDGSLDDWSERGLLIENLASADGEAAPTGTRAHVGWNDQDLLVAVQINDPIIVEAPVELHTADSIELFVARSVGSADRIQIVFAPGLQPPLPAPRFTFKDLRKNTSAPLKIDVARIASANGYTLECRLPWSMLGWKPEGEIGLQLIVNNIDAEGETRRKLTWHPGERTSSDPRQLNSIRLAETAGPAQRTIARWTSIAPNRLAVLVSSTDTKSQNDFVTARENDHLVAETALLPAPDQLSRRAGFILDTHGEDIALHLNNDLLSVIPLERAADTNTARTIARADYSLTPAVFAEETFPELRLSKPVEVEKLLGPVTLSFRYFDAEQREVTAPSLPGRYGVLYKVQPAKGEPIVRHQTLYRLPHVIDWRTSPLTFDEIGFPPETGLNASSAARHSKDLAHVFNAAWRTQLASTPDAAMVLAAISEAGAASEPITVRNDAQRLDREWWVRLQKKLGQWEQYDHVVELPEGYEASADKRWPVVLFLHGSGGGETREVLYKSGPALQVAKGRKFPFILVAPRSPSGPWQSWYPPQLGTLLDDIEAKYRVDPDRVYVTGYSMGGFGTWRLATEFPDRFAAIAMFCGGDEQEAARIAHLPVWSLHGDQDPTVPVEHTLRMVDALKEAGGEPRVTIFPGVGHICWEEGYAGQELYDWLLSHRRRAQ